MPWKESHQIMERGQFLKRLLDGERMTDLCKEFGISRKTGYKFLRRYQNYGELGLINDSTRPHNPARLTPAPVESMIIELRKRRPTWGASKLGEVLRRENPGVRIPTRSVIHTILDRHSLIKKRQRKRYVAVPTTLIHTDLPNGLWCADYKGHFRLGNQRYCYPLTITDFASRFIIKCEALESTAEEKAKPIFAEAFFTYGLPQAIRTDNGAPFSSRGLLGLSKLAIWWMKLGIAIERIEPGKPQQNGRHERMHLTLKQETTRPSAANLLQQQERFDRFILDFNINRPHEGLDMQTPATRYQPVEKRVFRGVTPEPEYPNHDFTCYVTKPGKVYVPGVGDFNLSSMFAGEYLGLHQEDDELWRVTFVECDLGFYDAKEGIFHAKSGEIR